MTTASGVIKAIYVISLCVVAAFLSFCWTPRFMAERITWHFVVGFGVGFVMAPAIAVIVCAVKEGMFKYVDGDTVRSRRGSDSGSGDSRIPWRP